MNKYFWDLRQVKAVNGQKSGEKRAKRAKTPPFHSRMGVWGGIVVNSSPKSSMSHTMKSKGNQTFLRCKTPEKARHAPISY